MSTEPNADLLGTLLSTCLDVSFGTLWWVREDLWRETLENYDPDSGRKGHPGMSLRDEPLQAVRELIPMLIGITAWGPVAVRGLSRREPHRVTHFGANLTPAPIPTVELLKLASDADLTLLTGHWYQRKRAIPNLEKPKCDAAELADLKRWIAKIASNRKSSFRSASEAPTSP